MSFSPSVKTRKLPQNNDILYKTGVIYQGSLKEHLRCGLGTLTYPDGSSYTGLFLSNKRNGEGCQVWPDGSKYKGEFLADLRQGQGQQLWTDGSVYVGAFFRDRRHGAGKYRSHDGSAFSGMFYLDKREGYGTLTYPNKAIFQGLYKADQREGPGVFAEEESHDIGLWHGEKLIKLCSAVENAFKMQHHSEFEYFREDHVPAIALTLKEINRNDIVSDILNPMAPFDYADTEVTSSAMFSDCLEADSLGLDIQTFEREFFKLYDNGEETADQLVVSAWNATPSCIALQRHVLRHRHCLGLPTQCSRALEAVLTGSRAGFNSPGPLERDSMKLLQAAVKGDVLEVRRLLMTETVSADVADSGGCTSLLLAATNCHLDTINCLLDFGADINKLTDEGLSPLSVCFVYYYPPATFKKNVAEAVYVMTSAAPEPEMAAATGDIKSHSMASAGQSSKSPVTSKSAAAFMVTGNGPSQARFGLNEKPNAGDEDTGQQRLDSGVGTEMDGLLDVVTALAAADEDEAVSEEHSVESPQSSEPDNNNNNKTLEGRKRLDETGGMQFNNTSTEHAMDVSQLTAEACRPLQTSAVLQSRNGSATRSAVSVGLCSSAQNEAVQAVSDPLADRFRRWETIQLLLRRGADPSVSTAPLPPIIFAVKAADVEAVRLLLLKGVDVNVRLPAKAGRLSPLHLAVAAPGTEGVEIVEHLLNALADPDARAAPDTSYLMPVHTSEDDGGADDESMSGTRDRDSRKDERQRSSLTSPELGRTALHIACSRDDDYELGARIVMLLLEHGANPDVLCNGHSPLSLAIVSGNDLAIEKLLRHGANPSLVLTHGNGNALCVAGHTAYEHRREPAKRVALVDKLIAAGADILALTAIGGKKLSGTALDYAYHIFNQDRRIAHMPYHALTHAERETYNARRHLLAHMGDIVREKCIERERLRLEEEQLLGIQSRSPSRSFLLVAGGRQREVSSAPGAAAGPVAIMGAGSKVTFGNEETFGLEPTSSQLTAGVITIGPLGSKTVRILESLEEQAKVMVRKPIFKYCYNCGRSVNVRLTACTRCKEVYFCSKACKLRAWNTRHKDECVRIQGSKTPSVTNMKNRTLGPMDKVKGRAALIESHKLNTRKWAAMEKSYNLVQQRTDPRITVPIKGRSGSMGNLPTTSAAADRATRELQKLKIKGQTTSSASQDVQKAYSENYSFE